MNDKPCTLLIHYDKKDPPTLQDLKKTLEKGSREEKIEALKQVILMLLNGEQVPQLLMYIIRFVMPIDDHTVKKLLLLYFEIVDKTTPDGKLLHEMILVCNALRNDLNHPNEYVRGSTLRFVSKLKEPEILEPLLTSIKSNLEYKHAYVRRNAVLALYNVYKNFDYLYPDAPELVYKLLLTEGDASCKRNAFIMLFNCAQDKAIQYLTDVLDQVAGMGEMLQFIVVELIRKVCRSTPNERPKYLRCLFTLLSSPSSAVQFEAAGTLIALSSAPTAVKAATSTYIDLLIKESDNNVKMVVLDKLTAIKQHHPKVLQDLLMNVLGALTSPNMDIRKKTLDIVLDLVSPKNVEDVVMFLKKEIQKTQSKEIEDAGDYRQLLIQSIHSCAVKYSDVASNIIHVLMDFVGDMSNSSSAVDVIIFVREVMESYPNLRPSLLKKLLENLPLIKSGKVFRGALWILGEYSSTTKDVDRAFTTLKENIGSLPFFTEEEDDVKDSKTEEKTTTTTTTSTTTTTTSTTTTTTSTATKSTSAPKKPAVTSDGSYATQTALPHEKNQSAIPSNIPSLRSLILKGDFFLASSLSFTLTKLFLRIRNDEHLEFVTKNLLQADILLILTSLLRLGHSGKANGTIDPDSAERIVNCIKMITSDMEFGVEILKKSHEQFSDLLKEQQKGKVVEKKEIEVKSQVDDLLKIRQLQPKKLYDDTEFDDDELSKATGMEDKKKIIK